MVSSLVSFLYANTIKFEALDQMMRQLPPGSRHIRHLTVMTFHHVAHPQLWKKHQRSQ